MLSYCWWPRMLLHEIILSDAQCKDLPVISQLLFLHVSLSDGLEG